MFKIASKRRWKLSVSILCVFLLFVSRHLLINSDSVHLEKTDKSLSLLPLSNGTFRLPDDCDEFNVVGLGVENSVGVNSHVLVQRNGPPVPPTFFGGRSCANRPLIAKAPAKVAKPIALKVYPATLDKYAIKAKPLLSMDQLFIQLDRTDLNLTSVTKQVNEKMGGPHVICSADGRPIPDDPVTKDPEYWIPSRRNNATKILAIPETDIKLHRQAVETLSSSDDEKGSSFVWTKGRKKRRCSLDERLDKKVQEKRREAALKAAAEYFKCCVCRCTIGSDPVFCLECCKIVGCAMCIMRWQEDDEFEHTCPLCRKAWVSTEVKGTEEVRAALQSLNL